MKKKSKKGLRGFQLKVLGYGNWYYINRIADLEKALAKRPRRFQIDLIGDGEIPADWALLIRSILIQRTPHTQLITNARSSLQGGSVLVWLLGDRRMIRDDARIFFRRVETPEPDDAAETETWKTGELKYADSFFETDPEDVDYVKVLQLINEYLPVKELAGQVVNLPMLREFSLVDSEEFDRFLAAAFGKPRKQRENSTMESECKRIRRDAKASRSE
ncbi:MAG TPA: hypothetical protein VMF08_14750 [Candidatus Sulfotelmatobacter sp.]|nr:hypothetical protein [Candidatus Sulfotelmatobacter sp.]